MKKGVRVICSILTGFVSGVILVSLGAKKILCSTNKKEAELQSLYNIMYQWMYLKQNGISLEKYFFQKGYKSIAIYGMGKLGIMLYEDLKETDIIVKYGIDRDLYCTYPGLRIVAPQNSLEKVDAIVVTSVRAFVEIEQFLSEKTDIPVISIEEMIYEI